MPDGRPLSEREAEPEKPDYDRLRDEVERGLYPFEAYDEGVLFARAEWLEARVAELSGRLDGAVILTVEEADIVRGWLPKSCGGETCADPRCVSLQQAAALLCGRPGKETE